MALLLFSPATDRLFHIFINKMMIAAKWQRSPTNLNTFILLPKTSDFSFFISFKKENYQFQWRRGLQCIVGCLCGDEILFVYNHLGISTEHEVFSAAHVFPWSFLSKNSTKWHIIFPDHILHIHIHIEYQ